MIASFLVTPQEKITAILSDPGDNKFLEAAVAGKAAAIVSGEHHLLELGSYAGIPILTAQEFLDWLEAESS